MDFAFVHLGHRPSPSVIVMPPCFCPFWPLCLGDSVQCSPLTDSAEGRDPVEHLSPPTLPQGHPELLHQLPGCPEERSDSALELDCALPNHRCKPLELCRGFPHFPALLSDDLDPCRCNARSPGILHSGPATPVAPQSHAPGGPLRFPQGPGQGNNPFLPQALLQA